jgi:peptidoglycan/LPS O-acetylase OafA/YrhL
MGLLRLFLAITVIAAHTGPSAVFTFVGGDLAVEVFFVISGFYMQLVLSSARYPTLSMFYLSRAMRLLPPYWLVAFLSLLLAPAGWFMSLAAMGTAPTVYLTAANATLLMQDTTLFLQSVNHSVRFASSVASAEHPLYKFLLVAQAWSLSLEMYFYALVPALARLRTRYLIVLLVASLAARIIFYSVAFDQDPWTHRFFPFEIAMFVSGMLAYRYFSSRQIIKFAKTATAIIWIYLLASGLFMADVPAVVRFVFPLVVALFLPAIFSLSQRSSLDTRIGELSYPVYLVHLLILTYGINAFRATFPLFRDVPIFFILTVLSIAAGYALLILVDRPIDRIRHLITERKAGLRRGEVLGVIAPPLA